MNIRATPFSSRIALLSVLLWLALGLPALVVTVSAADVLPPAPKRYFNDYANITRPATQTTLNAALEQFEKDASSQIVVAIFPKMDSNSPIEDHVNRLFRAWEIGQKQKNNGVLLAVFAQDRKLRIEVGYGLEGAIPDATAKMIIDREITPRFRAGDFDGGLTAGVNALMQAARGEYRGTGRTANEGRRRVPWPVIIFIGISLLFLLSSFRSRGTMYGGRRSRRSAWGGPIIFPGGWGGGGGGGGWSGGGGFSGGGGSSGGGGASGSW